MTNGMDNAAAEQLRSFVERIERLEEEKATLAADVKDVYSEAKSIGFEPKIMRKLIALRKKKAYEIEEEEAVFALYRMAVGV